jgi:hypothetical protein
MATDVARLSFDQARQYTGVVPQQGRVSLEAEQNEQRVIDAEERRRDLLDIVGPAGTPDDGYAVTGSGGDVVVNPGRMYVGGLRLQLDAPVPYSKQPDWLDRPDDESGQSGQSGIEHVVLVVEEVDVTAVEDVMLYEPALGGPDGAGSRSTSSCSVPKPRPARARWRAISAPGRPRDSTSTRRRCA